MIRKHCDWCGIVEMADAKIKTAKGMHQELNAYSFDYPRAYDLCPTCFGALRALIATARERGIAVGDLAKPPPKPKSSRSWMKKIWS